MSSNSEVSHANNVVKFEKLIASCAGFGPAFQPSKSTLQLSSMQQLLMDARAALALVTDRGNAFNLAKNARIATFDKLVPLTNRIIDTLMASDASDKTKSDAKHLASKIKGIRLTKKGDASSASEGVASDVTAGNESASRTRSAAQTSRDQLIEHFSRLLALLATEIEYNPNEPELQLYTLQQFLEEMRMTHSAFILAEVEVKNARLQRTKYLYEDKTGICDIAKATKLYVKGAFKRDSPQYKQISGLTFVKYKS